MGELLSKDSYLGFEYEIWANSYGCRCGYVKIPKDHLWYGIKDYDQIPCNVHGGLTFGRYEGDYYIIGFDCAHYDDLPDPSLGGEFLRLSNDDSNSQIRTQEYVINECKNLCEQANNARRV